MNRAEELIQKLDLRPHPEGGFFKETYRNKNEINKDDLSPNYLGKRNYSTSIYFLLTSDKFSAFHKINQDEIWHFYEGSPIRIHIISPKGEYSNVVVGPFVENKQVPQFVVKGGDWFASEVINDNSYSLVGCTVSPGFDYKDFKLANRKELIAKFPSLKEIITKFTNN